MATDRTPEQLNDRERRSYEAAGNVGKTSPEVAKARAAVVAKLENLRSARRAPSEHGIRVTEDDRGRITATVDGDVVIRPRRLEGDEVSGLMPLGDA